MVKKTKKESNKIQVEPKIEDPVVETTVVEEVKPQSISASEKSDKQAMKEFFASQKKVLIRVDKMSDKPNCRVKMLQSDGSFKEFPSYGELMYFNINGYPFYIPRNIMVEVPEAIATELRQNDDLMNKGKELTLENTRGLAALAELPELGND